jgi:hypothetical protein
MKMNCIVNLETKTIAVGHAGKPILATIDGAYQLALLAQKITNTAWASLPWTDDPEQWNSPATLPKELAPWLE